ncbi:MAG TPA: ABC transporter permease [Candidatus Microbacterium pullistercoris]|nr:ABC transporter permease [Candidatus Microbacterium pullistercoris]
MNRVQRFFDSTTFLGIVQYRVIIILVATFVLAASLVPGFFEFRTLSLSIDRVATLGIVAVGLTVVLIAGQLDLSVGSTLALSGIAAIGLQPTLGTTGAAIAALLIGIACGAVNGFLVVVLKVNSLVATLASMLMFRAICHTITDSRPLSGEDPLVGLVVTRPVGGTFSPRALIFFVAVLLLALWLRRTVAGRNLFAVGSSSASATASGIRSNAYLFGAFVFSGAMAGAAGIMQSLAVNTGSPVFGETTALTGIAAVVIGGTRLEGGRGSALGTLGGLLVLAFLTTSMEYQSIPAYIQDIVTGIILLLLILLDRFVSGKARRAEPLAIVIRRWLRSRRDTTTTQEGMDERTLAP